MSKPLTTIKYYFYKLVVVWPVEFWKRNHESLNLKIDRWRVKKAKRKADLLHSIDGKRYFVLRDGHNLPIAVNRHNLVMLKKTGLMSKEVNMMNVYEECLYYTGQPKEFKELKKGDI